MPRNPSADELKHLDPVDKEHPVDKEYTDTSEIKVLDEWLDLARQAYHTGSTFKDANISQQTERNLALFQSRHPAGSKYHSESYKYRSKLFRPKIRSVIRRGDAAAAAAFFSTSELVNTTAPNPNNKEQVVSAEIIKELMNHRLEYSIPWFITCVGAHQDAQVQGVCLSYNYWDYQEEEVEYERPSFDENSGMPYLTEEGHPAMDKGKEKRVIVDEPCIKLLPLENLIIDPSADWIDPINTSPYLIELIPMYIFEVKNKMENPSSKTGEPEWFKLSESELKSGLKQENDPVRQVREGNRRDSQQSTSAISEYDIVWVHRNIVKNDGRDYVYYTLGTTSMLSEPVPIEEVYFHGVRPYTYGYCELETHKLYPSGKPEMGEGLQTAANDILNQRMDNVKLTINKRYKVNRNSNTDIDTLKKSVPGSIILTNDPKNDIVHEEMQDVTVSAYKEQELINLDFDELLGNFSASSVNSNRKLNETVGGMKMLSDDADSLTEFSLRVFAETWVEPTLRQLALLEQYYESDETILGLVGEKLKLPKITEQMLMNDVHVRVNVGFGATNPQQRVDKLVYGMSAVAQIAPMLMQKIKGEEILKEILGSLGYKDGSRFFEIGDNPEAAQYEQIIQELKQQLQTRQLEVDGRIEQEKIRAQGSLQVAKLKAKTEFEIAQMEAELEYVEKQLKAEGNAVKRGELVLEKTALIHNIANEKQKLSMDKENSLAQVIQNDQYQMVPGAKY